MLIDLIGNTPLIPLTKLSKPLDDVLISAKAEFLNPSGSVKDRAAKGIILDGIRRGLLTSGKKIIDATSGNTGISYAMIGASLDYEVIIYAPKNLSEERKRLLGIFGAQIVFTDPLQGSDGSYREVIKRVEADPDSVFYGDQYNNPANPKAHYESTGPEILAQTEKPITHFVSSMGTGGTFTGTSRFLKDHVQGIKTIAVQPDSPLHGIEGTKNMKFSMKPGILDESLIDDTIVVSTNEAYEMARRLAKEEGLAVGISAGANVAASLRLAKTLPPHSHVVTILCDSASRYLSDSFWGAS